MPSAPVLEFIGMPNTLDGWWVDEHGELHECDHRKGYHHADIAIDELELENEEPGEDDEDDDWFRDHAIQEAFSEGWVRGSSYNDHLSINWMQPMAPQTKRTVLKWLETNGPAYKEIVIQPPNSDSAVIFQDSRRAARFIYNDGKKLKEALLERTALDHNVNSLGRPISGNPEAFWKWFGRSKVKDKQGRPMVVFHGTDSDFSKFDPDMSNVNTNTGVPKGAFVFSDHAGVASSYSAAQFDVHGWRDPKIAAAFRELMNTGSFDDQMAFLADNPAGYDDYKEGGNVMPVYLRIEKPLVVDAKGSNWRDIYFRADGEAPEEFTTNEIASYAKERGYDGCIIKNVKDVNKGPHHQGTTFFVFSPNQIKSAISGSNYSPASDHIHEDVVTEGTYKVFHGTDAKFGSFDDQHLGSANGTAPINMTGFNFTDSADVAKTFGGNVLACEVTINKPRVIDAKGANYSDFKHKINDVLDRVDRSKYDGIIIKNYMDAGKYGDDYLLSNHYIPFSKSQINVSSQNLNEAKETPAQKFIAKANELISEPNLRLSLWAEDYDEVSIQRIVVDSEYRGEGIASAALKVLCKLADRRGITLFLEALPEDDEDMDQDIGRLMRFYAKFGFQGEGSNGMMFRSPSIKENKDTLELPDIEVGDVVLVGKFKNRKATVKGFKTDDNNQPVLKTDKGDQKLFKPRLTKLMTEDAGLLEPTPENIARARTFALIKWKERAAERLDSEPNDLSRSCKFTSLFAQRLFGGKIHGNWQHQFLKLNDGTIVDLNIDAEDVKRLGDAAHSHDPIFFTSNPEHKASMKSVQPRIDTWVREFTSSLNESVLTEGLIAIPAKMLEEIDFYLTYSMLWKMRGGFKGNVRKLPEQYRGFLTEVEKFGEQIPKEAHTSDNVQVWSIKVSTDGLPESYAHLKPRLERIRFAIDWRPAKTMGVWRADKDALIVYPMSLDYMRWYPSERSDPDDLKIALATLRETITHELRHMVQHVFLNDYPDQRKINPGYAEHGAEYYKSPVEFDPSIGSAVQEFLNFWENYGTRVPLKKAIRQFTGMQPSGLGDIFSPPKFFVELKKGAPVRYRTAVTKFVKELQSRLAAGSTPTT